MQKIVLPLLVIMAYFSVRFGNNSIYWPIGVVFSFFLAINYLASSPKLFLVLGTLGIIIEIFALKTGFPYTYFSYSDLLGPKLFFLVPVTTFLSWPIIVLGAFQTSQHKPLLAIFLIVLADIVIDPAATRQGYWSWFSTTNLWYGVPIQNFFGWVLSGAIGTIVVTTSKPKMTTPSSFLFLLFYWTWVNVFLSHLTPSLVGILLCSLLYLTTKAKNNATNS